MRNVTLLLPDQIAKAFEAIPQNRKESAALLTAAIAKKEIKSLDDIFSKIDSRVIQSQISTDELNQLIDSIS